MSAFSDTYTSTFKYPNMFYWMDEDEADLNLKKQVPDNIVPVPYHNGYMVPEACYVKYTLNVVAGKTYYFYGMMTKVGYVGMNLVENDEITVNGASYDHEETLHLQTNDNMATVVSGLTNSTVFDEVTLPSSYKKDQWYTICLPFALSESQVEEAFGKGTQLTIFNGLIDKGNNFTIKFLSHVDQNILPGQPYLIKPSGVDSDGDDLPNVDGVIGSVVGGADSKTRITFNTVLIEKEHFSTEKCYYGNDVNVNTSGTTTGETDYKFQATYSPCTPELSGNLPHPLWEWLL